MIHQFGAELKQRTQKYPFDLEPHFEVAPYRREFKIDENVKSKARRAGVLLNFYPKNEDIYFVLIERSTYKGTHSNQISLPGGKVEDNDNDIIETALREAREEVNLIESQVEVISKLSEVYIPPSNFLVTPILSYTPVTPNFSPEEREVKSILEIPLKELLDPNNFTSTKVEVGKGLNMDSPCFILQDKIVWGATCMILNEIKYILNHSL